jgi:hypothetical protein
MSETLADLIALAMKAEGVESGRALANKAEQQGLVITHTQINHMIGGTYRHKPKQSTIEAIATLARVPYWRVYEAAGVPQPGPPFAQELPPNIDRLMPHQRKAVIEVMRAFLVDAAASSDATVHQLHDSLSEALDEVPPVPDDVAARDEGGPSAGERARQEQDDDADRGSV